MMFTPTNPLGMFLTIAHPLYNLPTTAEIIDLWSGKGYVLSFPGGHVAHLTDDEIETLVGMLPTTNEKYYEDN